MGHSDHFIELVEGVKPDTPPKLALRGLSSNTFDIDVGAKKDPRTVHKMDINGFRFEVIPKEIFVENNDWSRSWIKDFSVERGGKKSLLFEATFLLSPLSANTTYLVRAASRNVAGFSDWTPVQEFTTLLKQPAISNKSASLHSSFLMAKSFVVVLILHQKIISY